MKEVVLVYGIYPCGDGMVLNVCDTRETAEKWKAFYLELEKKRVNKDEGFADITTQVWKVTDECEVNNFKKFI